MIINRLEFQGNPENLKEIEKMLKNVCPLTKKEEVLCFCNFSKYNNNDYKLPSSKMEVLKNVSFRYEVNNKTLIYTFNSIKDIFEIVRFLAVVMYYKEFNVEVIYHFTLPDGHGGKYRFFKNSLLADRNF
jgi:hypothetical protein